MKIRYENTVLEFTHCHRKPERSFFWKGKQFPVCARCTGIYLGYLSMPFFTFDVVALNLWISLLLVVPTYLDGMTQAFMKRESNNYLRLITGIMAGIGLMSVVAIAGKAVGQGILSLFRSLF